MWIFKKLKHVWANILDFGLILFYSGLMFFGTIYFLIAALAGPALTILLVVLILKLLGVV